MVEAWCGAFSELWSQVGDLVRCGGRVWTVVCRAVLTRSAPWWSGRWASRTWGVGRVRRAGARPTSPQGAGRPFGGLLADDDHGVGEARCGSASGRPAQCRNFRGRLVRGWSGAPGTAPPHCRRPSSQQSRAPSTDVAQGGVGAADRARGRVLGVGEFLQCFGVAEEAVVVGPPFEIGGDCVPVRPVTVRVDRCRVGSGRGACASCSCGTSPLNGRESHGSRNRRHRRRPGVVLRVSAVGWWAVGTRSARV
jgi:hypothetical protein